MITGYYHICGMNHWREVVMEQMRVLSRVFKGPLKIGLIAEQWEDGYVHQVMEAFGMQYELIHYRPGLAQYEFPTLAALERDCRQGLDGRVFYLHTKAVSKPADWKWQQWRWLMNMTMVSQLSADLGALPSAPDLMGANWVDVHPGYPYMEGNFWCASADYIRRLPGLAEFRQTMSRDRSAPQWGGERYAAELWIGQARPSVVSMHTNVALWEDEFWTSRPSLVHRLMEFHAA